MTAGPHETTTGRVVDVDVDRPAAEEVAGGPADGRGSTTAPRALHVVELAIDRVPGIDRPFALEDLSPGVNLIHGPNGAGKTQTGRAVHALVWPRTRETSREEALDLGRPTLHGTWTLDGATWRVDLDGGHPTWRRGGAITDPPTLPSVESRAHHRLGLRELLADTGDDAGANVDFARRIARAMHGGIDFDEAGRRLGFDASPSQPQGLGRALADALSALAAARADEAAVAAHGDELEQLLERTREAERAKTRAGLLARAIEHRTASEEVAELERELASFGPGMERIRGDEVERLATARDDRAARDGELADARARAEAARAAIAATGLPTGGVPVTTRTEASAHVDALERHEGTLTDARRRLDAARAGRDRARSALGATVDDAALAALEPVDPAPLLAHARAAAAHAERRARYEAARTELERDAPRAEDDDTPSVESLRRGIDVLGAWLQTPAPVADVQPPRTGWSWPLLAAAAVIAALAILLGVLVAPAWFAAAVAGVVFAVLARPIPGRDARAGDAPDDPRAAHVDVYARLPLPAPDAWTVDAVRDRIEALLDARADRELDDERDRRRRDRAAALEGEARRLEDEAQGLDEARRDLAATFGIAIADGTDAWLHVLGAALADWQRADGEVRRIEAEVERAATDQARVLAAFTASVEGFASTPAAAEAGDRSPTDAASAKALLRDVETRARTHESQTSVLETATRDAARLERERGALDETIDAIFEDAGVAPGDDAALAERLRRLGHHREVRDARQAAIVRRDLAAEALADADDRDAWLELEVPQLESLQAEAEQAADRLEELNRTIGAYREQIGAARTDHAVERALAGVDRARAALLDDRMAKEQGVVGAAVVEWLRGASADRTRPAVLRSASDVFGGITGGRYELRLDDRGDEPSFTAFDTVDGVEKRLHELSAGERVQLLLSVRLGFLEQEEGGVRLPIVLDEVLGTSDDERAGAVIDAVIEIARSGRQVFYFTAQPDEVGKWRGRLAGCDDVDHATFDLAAVRALASAEAVPLPIDRPSRPAVPAPEGRDHRAYGRALAVPGLDPGRHVGAVDPWHLLDDPAEVHALAALRVRQWGPVARLGALDRLPAAVPASSLERGLRRARVLEAIFAAWKVGRGRPVDRAFLEAADGVTDTFLDRVAALAAACDGDAAALLAGLEAGEVKGFRTAAIELLREELEASGHLDPAEPLDAAALRERALAAFEGPIDDADRTWLDRVLADVGDPGPTPRAGDGSD